MHQLHIPAAFFLVLYIVDNRREKVEVNYFSIAVGKLPPYTGRCTVCGSHAANTELLPSALQ